MSLDGLIDSIINEATVDAYGEHEQRAGFYAVLEENLVFPFRATIIGKTVTVYGLAMEAEQRVLARIGHNGRKYALDLLDLTISDEVTGSQWIAAYRKWSNHV